MEQVTINVKNNVKADAIKGYELFEWKLIENKNGLEETTLSFERDNSVPYYEKLCKLEKDFYKTSDIPLALLFVLIGVAFIYITLMAILIFTDVITLPKTERVLVISLPSSVIIFLTFILTYIRSKQSVNYLQNKSKRYDTFAKKIAEIKK